MIEQEFLTWILIFGGRATPALESMVQSESCPECEPSVDIRLLRGVE